MKNEGPNSHEVVSTSTETTEGNGSNNIETGAFLAVISALRPLSQASQLRLVEAALTFLGARAALSAPSSSSETPRSPLSVEGANDLPRRASVWISQANLSLPELDAVFHRTSSGVEFIAHSVPGKSNKERVRSCYLLCGVQGLLKLGEARFADEDARRICRELGCYDRANHATYLKALGNLVTGAKSTSYELTQPGLRAAAEVVREIQSMAGAYGR
jgi:hypothetical protein